MKVQEKLEQKYTELYKQATFKGSKDTQLSLSKKKSRLYNVSNELRTEIEEKTKERLAKNMGIEKIPITFTDNTDIEKYKNIEYNKAKEGIINDEYGSNGARTKGTGSYNEDYRNQQTNGIGDNNTSTNIQASQNDSGLYNGVQGDNNRPSSISKNGENNNKGELESSFNLPQ
jgi:hypothetical protein